MEDFVGQLTNCTVEAKDQDSGEYGTVIYTVDSKVRYIRRFVKDEYLVII